MIRLVGLHILPQHLKRYGDGLRANGLQCTTDSWVSTGSQFSSGYDSRTGLASSVSLREFLEEQTAWRPGDTLILCAWSAGCWAVQAWLRRAIGTHDFDLADAIVLLDGAHLIGARADGLTAFARAAMALPERHLLVSTNSEIATSGYPSTSGSAEWLLDELGITGHTRTRPDAGYCDGVRVIDDGGARASDHVHHVATLGPELLRDLVGPWLLSRRDTEPVPSDERPDVPDTDPAIEIGTLGERCVAWCRAQMASQNPPSAETRADWFRLCVRRGGPLVPFSTPAAALAGWNHCAAAQSAALAAVVGLGDLVPDQRDTLPHEARAGARELMADSLDRGLWHDAAEVVAGDWLPSIGDLAIYDRSVPGRPETAWWGHVDRVCAIVGADAYENIGCNEGRDRWRVEVSRFDSPRLLGFASMGDPAADYLLSPEQVARVQALAASTLDDLLAEILG